MSDDHDEIDVICPACGAEMEFDGFNHECPECCYPDNDEFDGLHEIEEDEDEDETDEFYDENDYDD